MWQDYSTGGKAFKNPALLSVVSILEGSQKSMGGRTVRNMFKWIQVKSAAGRNGYIWKPYNFFHNIAFK